MRLIDRNDTSLAIALVASAVVIFQRPLHLLIEAAHVVELRYDIDLLPGLCVLVGAFGFHQYAKRQQAKAAATAAVTEAAQARARSDDLERLVAFGQALGSALDPAAMRQVFWRYMPAFAGNRELWMLIRRSDGWDATIRDATAPAQRSIEMLETLASRALAGPIADASISEGLLVDTDLCLPMVVGDNAVGVVGVRNAPELTLSERHALGAAAALIAIAIRNSQLIAQTRESSVRDSLTGCFNRVYAIEALTAELHRARRTRRPVSVLMFDIDEFKSINDRHGHLAGDALLAAVGARLASMLRATDIKCRYGGDEFLVILPDTLLPGAEHVATTLLDALARITVHAGNVIVSPTVSVGVTTVDACDTEPMAVIAGVDAALYRAKRSGRNRFMSAALAPAV
ncbi:MAG: GGDEF domain-containing protein [Vicinamibacterales bacterium]